MRVGSLFAGVGGFDLGFQRCGMEPAWMVENDKQCQQVLRHHWPKAEVYGDIREVGMHQRSSDRSETRSRSTARRNLGGRDKLHIERNRGSCSGADTSAGEWSARLAPVGLICGGFPCQDYSVAGKRGGLVGDRGALWWEMRRVIALVMPTWVVGENVPGLLSSNGGRDFLTIIASLVQLGYGCTWAVLDSQHFGVAQRRRRLFIVGHSGGKPRPEILALSEGLFGHNSPSREAGERTADSLTVGANQTFGFPGDITGALPTKWHSAPEESRDTVVAFDWQQGGDATDEGCATLSTTRTQAVAGFWPNSGGDSRGLDPQDPIGALHGQIPAVTTVIPRRLTPTECERLQGFPNGHTDVDGMKDGPRYRMMGNAVTVNVVEWIGQRLMQAEQGAG